MFAQGCSNSQDESATSGAAQQSAPTPLAYAEPAPELFVDPEAEPDEGLPPLSVEFSANVEDNQGDVECEWDFGDGSARVAGLRPSHVFEKVADYEVVARCKDSTGLEGDGEVDVFVEADENPPPRPTRVWAPRIPRP